MTVSLQRHRRHGEVEPPDFPMFKGAEVCLVIIVGIFIVCLRATIRVFSELQSAFVLYGHRPLDLSKSL